MMNVSFVPSICIHRSIILTFIEKKEVCLSIFFPAENIFFQQFLFSFPQETSFPRQIPGSDESSFGLGVFLGVVFFSFFHSEYEAAVNLSAQNLQYIPV